MNDWQIRVVAGPMPEMNGTGIWVRRFMLTPRRQQVLGEQGWQDVVAGEYCAPTAFLPGGPEGCEKLITDLWATGARPKGWGHASEVAALKDHLADMKQIAFALLFPPVEVKLK